MLSKLRYCLKCGSLLRYENTKVKLCKTCASKVQFLDTRLYKSTAYNVDDKRKWCYPQEWTRTYREQIRYHYGYKCQVCGIDETQCKIKLHVHHIDYNKYNLNPDNLIPLCHPCHVKTNGNRETQLKWIAFFEPKKIKIANNGEKS